MELKELEELKSYSTETDLMKIVEKITDKVYFRGYDRQEIISLVNEIIKIDLLSVKYETREEILYFLCEAVGYYGCLEGVKWESIINIKDKLEDDLKEYVAELIESMYWQIPLQGDEKTLIQKLRAYIDPVDNEWFSRLRPASETQIEELKKQLGLDKAGIELPLAYTEFLRYAGEGAGGLFLPSLHAEMSVSSLISGKVTLQRNKEENNTSFYFTFLIDHMGICYTLDLDAQNQRIFLEEDYPVSANFENFVFQNAVKCYEEKYYARMTYFDSSINSFSNSEVGKKGVDLFEYVNDVLKMYNLKIAWFNDDYFYFARSNKFSVFIDRSGGGFNGKLYYNEIQTEKDIEKVLLSKIGANT